MTNPAAALADAPSVGANARIASFVEGFSIEVARPSAGEMDALRAILPAGAHIYLPSIPTRPLQESIDAAALVRQAGFEPVPHLAVRNFASIGAADDHLAALSDAAGVRQLLLVAGDREQPAGPLRGGREFLDSGVMQRRGITEIGVAGYPEGHPRIPDAELQRALAGKIDSAEQVGLSIFIVTQFCFDARPIQSWLGRLRDSGIEQPVRVGMAGPTSLATLMRYVRRCGVKASAQGLARHAHLGSRLFGMTTPDQIVRPLADARAGGALGSVSAHFFSFGGPAATARWASAVAAGRFVLDSDNGFQIDAP